MEIIIKHFDTTVTIKREHEDLSMDETFEMINAALIGISWQQCQIESYIIDWAKNIKSTKK